tara:strand:- start:1731 stop:1937 length:207 start_codon:yes stop_codon:yes gene_type:complete
MSKLSDKSLNDLRNEISELVETLDEKPYSANIIGICLRQIDDYYGKDEAEKAMIDFDLGSHGWSVPNV